MPDHSLHTILITGGRGALAGQIAGHFRKLGHEVHTFSRTAGDGHLGLSDLLTARHFAPRSTLLHLAWSTLPYSAEQASDTAKDADLRLMTGILDRISAQPTEQRPHFIFFSSGGTVYGNARLGQPSSEDDPCMPVGKHGKAKLAAEQLLARQAVVLGIRAAILRISNPYGYPNPSGRRQGIIPIAIDSAIHRRVLSIWGDGTAQKDYIHFGDFASAIEQAMLHRLTGTYNVCSGRSHELRDLLSMVEAATGHRLNTQFAPAHEWDVHDSLLSHARFCAATGWRPVISLEEGIRRLVAAST